jgi:tellurite resistance-related uncharacterized protein
MTSNSEILADRKLPDDLELVRTTPLFNKFSIPAGLLRDHRTSTWAKLKVEKGSVRFIEPPCQIHPTEEQRFVEANESQIIAPDTFHFVEIDNESEFKIEFYQNPATDESSVEVFFTKEIKEFDE